MSRLSQAIADLVDLGTAIDYDDTQPHEDRLHQDRTISRELVASSEQARIRGWLAARRELRPFTDEDQNNSPGAFAARSTRIVGIVLVIFGLILGSSCALAIFGYDGTTPVNVVHIIGVFVVLQLLLLLGYVLLALPARVTRWVPGLGGLQSILRGFSPGFFLPLLSRVLPQQHRETLSQLQSRFELNRKLYGQVASWIALEWSQRFAVCFHISALVTALLLTVFTDLAFGWSTTLEVAAQGFHRLTTLISVPWQHWWSTAVPDFALVEGTQFFRLESPAQKDSAEASLRAKWWPFVLMCMLFYALFPRLLTLVHSRMMLFRSLQTASLTHPGVRELQVRLAPTRIETKAIEREETQRQSDNKPAAELNEALTGKALVVDWSQAAGGARRATELVNKALGLNQMQFISVGGNRSLDDDRASFQTLEVQDDATCVFVTRAWETPTLDILDTIGDLRQQLNDTTTLVVLVLDNNDSIERGDFNVWQQTLGRLADPWLRAVSFNTDTLTEV